ncbi:plasmid stabilization protein, partial [Streptomyces hydrogenans]
QGPTYDQLYAEARRRNLHGRSQMNKAELERELGH